MSLNTPNGINSILNKICINSPSNGQNIDNMSSPASANSSCSSPSPEYILRRQNFINSNNNINMQQINQTIQENRRGRPRSEAITTLMAEGETSPSAIKCTYCNRVFPREKSLQAHLRIHTGKFRFSVIILY